MCGTAAWEWDPKRGGNRRAYEAVERYCPGCDARDAARTLDPNRNMAGITMELARNDRSVEAARRRLRAKKQRARK